MRTKRWNVVRGGMDQSGYFSRSFTYFRFMVSCAVVAGLCGSVHADHSYGTFGKVFDWQYQLGDPTHPGVTPLPELSNASASGLAYFLSIQPVPAVKVLSPLGDGPVWEFLNGPTPLTHIFAGFDNPGVGGDALTAIQIENLVFQASGTASSGASIGQYGLDNYHPDATNPFPTSGLSNTVYTFSGVNMANPLLLPGNGTFDTPGVAPNIRSSLFTLPIIRLSEVINASPGGHSVVPFVGRFNNTGTAALVNSEFDGKPAYETTDQLLSRGDFQALVTHYRMRGADGVIAHDGGIVGYTHEDFLDDTRDGWRFLTGIYDGDVTPISFDTTGFETSGTAWSGVVGDTPSGKRVATVLLSNLSDGATSLGLPSQFDGFDVLPFDAANLLVDTNDHRLLTFWLIGNEWHLLGAGDHFADDIRGGIGIGSGIGGSAVVIPEPASLAVLAAGCFLCLSRDRVARVA